MPDLDNSVPVSNRRGFRRLAEFVQDPTGGLSAMRLAFIVWALGSFVLWVVISVHAHALQPLDTSVVLVLGVLTGGKIAQRFAEKG